MNITFEWNEQKDKENRKKHGVSFYEEQRVFMDPNRLIAEDLDHSMIEARYYCFGKIDNEILTVRFTYCGHTIRIIGSGY